LGGTQYGLSPFFIAIFSLLGVSRRRCNFEEGSPRRPGLAGRAGMLWQISAKIREWGGSRSLLAKAASAGAEQAMCSAAQTLSGLHGTIADIVSLVRRLP
jgi:hypothetical protein